MIVPRGRAVDAAPPTRRTVAVFGATGSIGCSAIDVLERHRERFEVAALVAHRNVEKLIESARRVRPKYLGITDERCYGALREALPADLGAQLVCGEVECAELAALPEVDSVLAAVVGFPGMHSVVRAAEAGKRLLLANKESLVSGGELISELCRRSGATVIPVDSEHSALFQVLQGERPEDIEELVLTASGGPFRELPKERFASITPEQALKHPNWSMGSKITVDSATMVNKAFELSEAFWLFGTPLNRIKIVVHPQSIVHSLISFRDGSMIAQLGVPDMRVPIAYALSYPEGRLSQIAPPCDLTQLGRLDFLPLDTDKFRAPDLMRRCIETGGAGGAVFTIANDLAVEAFLKGALGFDSIVERVACALEHFADRSYHSLEDLLALRDEVAAWNDRA